MLVEHSFGSLTVQFFALQYPNDVAGIVLVDGAHEDQMDRFPAELNPSVMLTAYANQLRQAAQAAYCGEPVPDLVVPPEAFSDRDADRYTAATRPTPTRLETTAAEYEALDDSQRLIREQIGRGLGDVPLVVIRHVVPQNVPGMADEINTRYELTWQDLQEELAARPGEE